MNRPKPAASIRYSGQWSASVPEIFGKSNLFKVVPTIGLVSCQTLPALF
jgi:hypothetical protein